MSPSLVGLIVVVLGASLPTMDLAVNVAFPAIAQAFGLETGAIRWLVVTYVVTYASLMLAFGHLGDRIGHRRVFGAGLAASVAAYCLCAWAPSYGWLLAARFLQGVATAMLLSCAPALATLLYAEAERTKALAAYSSMLAAASVLAPMVGGMAIMSLGWSGVFWFRAPLALLTLVMLPLLPRRDDMHTRGSFDLPGALLLTGGIALLLLATALTARTIPVWLPLLAACFGAIAIAGFARREHRSAHSWLPRGLAREPDFVLLNASSAAVHFAAFAVPLLVPFYLAQIAGYTAANVGIALAASPAGMLLGSAVSAKLVASRGTIRAQRIAVLVVIVGTLAISAWHGSTDFVAIAMTLALHGVGVGLYQVAYTDTILATLPRHARGIAGSLSLLTRTVGVVVSASLLGLALETHSFDVSGGEPVSHRAFLDVFSSVFAGCAGILSVFLAGGALRARMKPTR